MYGLIKLTLKKLPIVNFRESELLRYDNANRFQLKTPSLL